MHSYFTLKNWNQLPACEAVTGCLFWSLFDMDCIININNILKYKWIYIVLTVIGIQYIGNNRLYTVITSISNKKNI